MQDTIIATSSTVNVGYDFLTPLLRLIFGSEGLISGVSLTGVVGFANLLWLIFVVISYIVVFIFLFVLTTSRYFLYSFIEWYEMWYFLNDYCWQTYKEVN